MQAADFLVDDVGVRTAAQVLATSLSRGPPDKLWCQSVRAPSRACTSALMLTTVHY